MTAERTEPDLGEVLRARRLGIIRNIVLFGFVAAVFYHYVQGVYLGRGYPFNTFLFIPSDRFMDYVNNVDYSAHLDPYNLHSATYMHRAYPPFAYVLGYLLSFLRPWGAQYLLLAAVFLGYLARLNVRYLWMPLASTADNVLNVGVLTLLPYPVLFALDRGNWDLLILVLLAAFVADWQARRFWRSTLFLVIMSALKGLPALLLLLYLPERRYRQALAAVAGTVALTLGSLALFPGGIVTNLRQSLACHRAFVDFYIYHGFGRRFSCSLLTLVSGIALRARPNLCPDPNFYRLYTVVTGLLLAVACVALVVLRMRTWARLTVLCALLILLPGFSSDYRLLLMLVPLWLYINEPAPLRFDTWYAAIFGLLLIPKAYALVESTATIHATLGVVLNPLLLLILVALVFLEPRTSAADATPHDLLRGQNT